MGFAKGAISFTRYAVEGTLPGNASGFIDEGLKKHAFRDVRPGGEKSMGWTALENALDTDFSYASYTFGSFVVFSFRMDRKVIAPALLKIRALTEEKRIATEKGTPKLREDEKKNIRERVRLELAKLIPPVPAVYEICWCPEEQWLLFGNLSQGPREAFEECFKNSFNLKLTPYLPWDPRHLPSALAEKVSVAAASPGSTGTTGREFLTWLWFKSEERNGSIRLPGAGDIELVFLTRLVLESGKGEYSESVVCRGLHADLREGKAALLKEKKITEARLRLKAGSDLLECTLKADEFLFQSLRTAEAIKDEPHEEDREGRLLERIHFAKTAIHTMDRLVELYLEKRLSPRWEKEELPRFKAWLVK